MLSLYSSLYSVSPAHGAVLEALHPGRYVAVEPESGDYFLADTLDAAADAAQAAHPDRRSHVLRVGHAAALHLGGAWS